MRPNLVAPLAVLLFAFPAPAQQTIDLNKWTVEHINSAGVWTIDALRLNALFTNVTINDVSVLYSDFTLAGVLEFRLTVKPVGDDDIVGFVLGFNPGDGSNPNSDYLLVDWKQVTQTFGDWGTAKAGLALSRVTGVPARGTSGGPIDLWSHTGVCKELARGNRYGQVGWVHGTNYNFRVVFTPGVVDISVNGQSEFIVPGTYKSGRFGCYNFSQSGMEFQFPVPGSLALFGNGCRGSAGTPYLFAPEVPMVGQRFPVVISNLAPTAPATLVVGGSNTTWQGVGLPFNLGVLGATGCTLYVSVDVLIPVTNYNGTGYINVAIPNDVLPLPVPFHMQGLTLDPAGNALGIVLSNAATGLIGIR